MVIRSCQKMKYANRCKFSFLCALQAKPEMALIGTSTGNVHVLNSVGQLLRTLCCGDEVMSITFDDDYIAALASDGVLTVWLKEGYINWWQVNLVCCSGMLKLLRYTSFALSFWKISIF